MDLSLHKEFIFPPVGLAEFEKDEDLDFSVGFFQVGIAKENDTNPIGSIEKLSICWHFKKKQ